MSQTYQEILDEIEAKKALLAEHRAEKIAEIKQIMADLDITGTDLGIQSNMIYTVSKPAKKPSTPGPAKYLSPDRTKTWSGHGRVPEWVKAHIAAGGLLTDLAISHA